MKHIAKVSDLDRMKMEQERKKAKLLSMLSKKKPISN